MSDLIRSPVVVNKYKDPYDVYIGRGSMWGNPYTIPRDGSREFVILRYRKWLWLQITQGKITQKDILSLSGKRLGCFCKPQACHGDIIVKAFNWVYDNKREEK